MERCRSGRTGRSRKPLSSLRGTEGSNPSLSANRLFSCLDSPERSLKEYRRSGEEEPVLRGFLVNGELQAVKPAANEMPEQWVRERDLAVDGAFDGANRGAEN